LGGTHALPDFSSARRNERIDEGVRDVMKRRAGDFLEQCARKLVTQSQFHFACILRKRGEHPASLQAPKRSDTSFMSMRASARLKFSVVNSFFKPRKLMLQGGDGSARLVHRNDRPVATREKLRVGFHVRDEGIHHRKLQSRRRAHRHETGVGTFFGAWREAGCFTALSENACKVELTLRYQFASALLEKIAGPAFHDITDTFIDAFVRRADEKSGSA